MAKPIIKAVLLSPQRTLGEKPLLVVGPSLGTSTVLWTETAALLGNDFDVIGWDLPGHGVSPAASETFSVAELADAVVELVDSIAPAQCSTTPEIPWAAPPAFSSASSTENGSSPCRCSAPERSSALRRDGWNAPRLFVRKALR